MNKIKPFIKPIILLMSGIILMILFKDKYIELFSRKKDEKDFIVEFTRDYKYQDGDMLYNINEDIDSYIVIKNNKELYNFKVITGNDDIEIEKVDISSTISLMINHINYNSIITFDIDEKSYTISAKKSNGNLEIIVEEKQE